MAEGHVCDQYTTHEWEGGGLGEYSPRKFLMLTILVFEINKGKNAQKVKIK